MRVFIFVCVRSSPRVIYRRFSSRFISALHLGSKEHWVSGNNAVKAAAPWRQLNKVPVLKYLISRESHHGCFISGMWQSWFQPPPHQTLKYAGYHLNILSSRWILYETSGFEFRGAIQEVSAGKEAPSGDENIRNVADVGGKELVVGFLQICCCAPLISPPLLCPGSQTVRIRLYWPRLNAVLMKARTDNSISLCS